MKTKKNNVAAVIIVSAVFIASAISWQKAKGQSSQQPADNSDAMMTGAGAAQTNSQEGSAVYLDTIPPGYRDWRLISLSHEAANLNSFSAILGNDTAIKAFREGTLPYPDGTIIATLHWRYVPSEGNNEVFGRQQSFVPGTLKSVQFMIKDSKKYAATGGWGFGQFDTNGIPAARTAMASCYSCHQAPQARDFIFTRYAQ